MTWERCLAAEPNRLGLDMLNMILRLDCEKVEVSNSSESQERHCSQAGFAAPCGYEV